MKKNTYMFPVIKASTFFFNSFKELKKKEKMGKICYGTKGPKYSSEIKKEIKKIEKGKYVILGKSGLFSIFVVYFSLLKKRDGILLPENVYEPNKKLIKNISKKYGIKIYNYYNDISYNELKKKYKKKRIKIFFVEAPGSITYEVPNLSEIIKYCKKRKIISCIDNSYSSGIYFKPFKIGFDISIQALTKFYSGNNDVLMGAIITKKKKIYKKIKYYNDLLGSYVDPLDCYLIKRNINSIKERYKKHYKRNIKIIKILKKSKIIEKVISPELKNNPGYYNFKKYFKKTNGLISIIFKKKIKKKKIDLSARKMKIFKIGYSWGGVQSLIMLYDKILNKRKFFKKYKKRPILRIFVGLENFKKIRNDLKRFLRRIN